MTTALTGKWPRFFFDELHGGLAAFHAHQRIKDDPARVALDDGEVGYVIAAHLIDAVGHLEEPVDVVVYRVLPTGSDSRCRALS